MEEPYVSRALNAAEAIATSLGLAVERAIVLQNSNKLLVRLLPCDVVARVAPVGQQVASVEVELARQLADAGSPVAELDPRVPPRVHELDGFVVTLWTYYETTGHDVAAPDYAHALAELHAGMRELDVVTPHFTDRAKQAQQLLADRERTPDLVDAERKLLSSVVRDSLRAIGVRAPAEQLLHGEPHPGNLLATARGPLFIDFETCCRGPVEFDLAHAPDGVGGHYPGVDRDLLRDCRLLVLAMVTTWRWDRDDQLPNGRALGATWFAMIRDLLSSGQTS